MIRVLLLLSSLLMVAIISPTNGADLAVDQLKNSQYLVPSWENPDQGGGICAIESSAAGNSGGNIRWGLSS